MKASERRPWNVRGSRRASLQTMPRPASETGFVGFGFWTVAGLGTAGWFGRLFFFRLRPVAISALREGVPRAADRQDEPRVGWIVLQLLAQVADVDVDSLLVLIQGLVVADELEQLAPRVDAPRATRQMAQYLELGRRQRDAAVAALTSPPLQIYEVGGVTEESPAVGIREIAAGSAQRGLGAAYQLEQCEGPGG